MNSDVKLIGLTGTNASGKGEAAAFFQARGYEYHSLSDVIRDELASQGRPATRNNLIIKGNELREKEGADVLARRIFEKITGRAVIDSIRNPDEILFLRSKEGFILLAIDAPVRVRYERARLRGRDESASTLQEFIAKEREEMTDRDNSQQILTCMGMADYIVTNEATLEKFHKKLERYL
jgi:dephospho-CoA kinase